MDIKDLEINIKYKSYKIIREVLNEQVKTGKAKQLQLKDWERYFKYHREGNAFIIDEIYDVPKKLIIEVGVINLFMYLTLKIF